MSIDNTGFLGQSHPQELLTGLARTGIFHQLIRFNERLGDGIRRIGESQDKLRSIYVLKTTAILPRVPELNGTLVYYKIR